MNSELIISSVDALFSTVSVNEVILSVDCLPLKFGTLWPLEKSDSLKQVHLNVYHVYVITWTFQAASVCALQRRWIVISVKMLSEPTFFSPTLRLRGSAVGN